MDSLRLSFTSFHTIVWNYHTYSYKFITINKKWMMSWYKQWITNNTNKIRLINIIPISIYLRLTRNNGQLNSQSIYIKHQRVLSISFFYFFLLFSYFELYISLTKAHHSRYQSVFNFAYKSHFEILEQYNCGYFLLIYGLSTASYLFLIFLSGRNCFSLTPNKKKRNIMMDTLNF